MRRWISSVVDIRKGELGVTLLMAANLYIILVAYYFLKPARDSLFLTKLGAEQLPYVFILTALLIVPITSLYARGGRSLKLNQLFTTTAVVGILSLIGLRYLMQMPHGWIPYAFYIWVSIYGVLMTSQYWLLANAIYDSNQAKRLFALLGLAAILGAWTGGEVTGIVTQTFNVTTRNLLLLCMGFVSISIVLTNIAWYLAKRTQEGVSARQRREEDKLASARQLFDTIRSSRHLLLIIGIITVTMIVASLIDFQFKSVTLSTFPEQGELTAFLGKFYGRLSLVSFLLQLLLTYRFLRVLGVGGSIMLLPIGLVLGTASILIVPGLVSAVLLRGADGALKYSIDKTGRELLFLPVPLAVKKRTKVFIDMFVDRWARGIAGGLLLLLIYLFEFSEDPIGAVWKISLVVMAFLLIWLILTLMMRKEYVNTFRKALEKREIDPDDIHINITDASTVKALIPSLSSTTERKIAYALDMLQSTGDKSLVEPALPLIAHTSAEVRYRAVRLLFECGDAELIPKIKPLMEDDDSRVRCEAVRFIMEYGGGERDKLIVMLLRQPDVTVRTAVLTYVVEYDLDKHAYLVDDQLILSFLNDKSDSGEAGRIEVARALGQSDLENSRKYVKRLLHDPSPSVVKEVLLSIGKLRCREMVPSLIDRLGEKQYRAAARNGLTLYGSGALGTLADYLVDDTVDPLVRRAIPRVMSEIPEQSSVDLLTDSFHRVGPGLKYFVVKALNQLKKKYPSLKFARKVVNKAMIEETRAYYRIHQVLHRYGDADDHPAHLLLTKALVEKLDRNLEQIFRLLGLSYPSADIYSAYLGLVSNRRQQRASAIEFLDNLLDHDTKKYLLPIIDEVTPSVTITKGRELFGFRINNREQALAELIEGRDSWLKACAVLATTETRSAHLMDLVEKAREDRDPIVGETAQLVIRKKHT